MKVALSIEVTDDQRRALASGKLATRDMVRAYVEGALAALGAPIAQPPVSAPAHNPRAEAPALPSTPSDWPDALVEKVGEKRAEGWRQDEIDAYVRGWFYKPRST